MTEVYVTYETAKLLHKQGFDEPCRCIYETSNVKAVSEMDYDVTNFDLDSREYVCYLAPTLQMAMKWLREVHNRYVEISMDKAHNFKDIVFRPTFYDKRLDCLWESDNFPTYEEACEAAIRYCLENLV